MASTSKTFRKCVDPCLRYLTPDDTHDHCVFCLGEEHAHDVLEGAICVHCELFSMKKLRSRLSLFSSKEDQPSASRDLRPTVAEARRGMKSWGSRVDLADELERELSLSHESARNESEPLDYDDPAASALLVYNPDEQEMAEDKEVETESSQISCPAYEELLEVMERATARLASYLSMGKTASLKVPSLPSKPLQDTSRLNGKAYAAAGQAVASLHTMAVLQAYQADLLKDLDKGQGLSPDEVAELRRTTDLALRATKQAATAMGRSMAAMVVTERHLWVNLADLERKEKGFLLDAPVSPSELFGTSVDTVIEKFREARARSAAFRTFIPRRSRSEPEQNRGPGPSRSEDRRRAQRASVVTRAPPPPAGRGRGRYRSKRGRQDLRKVIQAKRPQQRSRQDQSN